MEWCLYFVLAQNPEWVSVDFCKIVRCLEHGNIEHQRLPQVSVTHLDIIVNKVFFKRNVLRGITFKLRTLLRDQ